MPSSLCPRSWRSEVVGRIEPNVWNMLEPQMEETKHRENLLFFTDLSGASPNVSRVVRLQRLLSSITCKWLGAEQHRLRKVFCLVLDNQAPSGPNSRYDLKHYVNKVSAVLLGFSPYSPHIWSSLSPQSPQASAAPVSHWPPPQAHLVERPALFPVGIECVNYRVHWSQPEKMLFCT